jgi:type IV pilus assembly protein PilC
MPYYYWRGVELTGNLKKGKLFARSRDHLDALLLKREIALMNCTAATQWFARPIFLSHKIEFFKRLAVLIDAGVSVPNSLALVADQLDHPRFQEIIYQVCTQVTEGKSLSQAMQSYPELFSVIMIQLVSAGEESGNLAQALDGICAHLIATQEFYSRLRSVLMLPLITVLFFLIIAAIIFTVIMPRFVEIISSFNQQLPPLTRKLMAISDFMMSGGMIICLSGLVILVWLLWRITQQGMARKIKEYCMLHTPLIGTIIQQRFLAYSLRSIALLVQGGVPIVHAVKLVRQSTDHSIFEQQLFFMEQDIQAGSSLSDAMARHPQEIFSPDTIAMVQVAEESGRLGPLLHKTATTYHDRVIDTLSMLTMVLQPIIMILLGLLVGALVYAVYGPIMNMSNSF